MKLEPTRVSFAFADESGYRFTVDCDLDPEYGWHGTVGIQSFGLKTPEDAVKALVDGAKQFVRLAKE